MTGERRVGRTEAAYPPGILDLREPVVTMVTSTPNRESRVPHEQDVMLEGTAPRVGKEGS